MQIEGCLSQLPPEIPQRYREIGVSALYSWQNSLLLDLKQSDRNYLITTPPNTGKSLVADLLAFHYVSQPRKVCIVHSSFTLAKSRFRFLEPLWFKSGKKLVGFFEHHLRPLDDDWDGAVLVIEQMNLLFNEMVANKSLSKIGLIIIHEFHSFYDRSKGAEYECFLTKLKFYNSRNPQNQVRIICFGNYVPKSKELVEWLDAELYLMETYKKNIHRWVYFRDENSVYNMKTQRVVRYLDKLPPDSQGGVIRLALESINSGGQVIIYTASNHEANKMAKLFTTEFANLHSTKKSQYSAELEKRTEALRELRDGCARRLLKWDRMLVKTMAYGIGVYHTGLTQIERDIVEKAFRDDSLILLITTNQSSNLKLASARVLIVPSMTGENAVTRHTLLQVGARCTKVVDEQYGEAYLVISRAEMRDAMNIMRDYDCEPKIDSMNYARVFLEAIHTNLASNLELLQELWEQKFFASSVSHIDLVETLKNDWMIECEKTNLHPSQPETSFETGVYSCTSIGRATADAALRTDISLFILHDLDRANQLMVLANELHLVYLVTPSNAIFWESREEWANLESIYRQLNDDERKVAKLAHVKESFLHQRASGDKNGQKPKEEVVYEHNRFFCSLALYRLISEEPFDDVAKQFKLSRGELEILQQQSAQYATKILPFCREMEWHHLLILLKDLPFRIAFGVRNELNELVQIRGIDQKRARALFSDGFNSWAKILWASSDRISTALTQTFPMFNCSYKFEWLVGEEPLPLPEAALRIQQRARELLESRLREQGFDTSHLKHMLDNVKG